MKPNKLKMHTTGVPTLKKKKKFSVFNLAIFWQDWLSMGWTSPHIMSLDKAKVIVNKLFLLMGHSNLGCVRFYFSLQLTPINTFFHLLMLIQKIGSVPTMQTKILSQLQNLNCNNLLSFPCLLFNYFFTNVTSVSPIRVHILPFIIQRLTI